MSQSNQKRKKWNPGMTRDLILLIVQGVCFVIAFELLSLKYRYLGVMLFGLAFFGGFLAVAGAYQRGRQNADSTADKET